MDEITLIRLAIEARWVEAVRAEIAARLSAIRRTW